MTIRFKLTMGFIAVVLVLNSLLSFATVKHLGKVWLREIQSRVRLDLNSARAAYACQIMGVARLLDGAALNEDLARAVAAGDTDALVPLLHALYERGEMDVLDAVAPDGRVLCRARQDAAGGGSLAGDPVLEAAIAKGTAFSGTVLLNRAVLEQEGAGLVHQAEVKLRDTPAARSTTDTVRQDALALAAAVPLFDRTHRMVGLLYAANLLNHRHELVDRIRDQVFPHELYGGKPVGTVTLFQQDVRISTNVRDEHGERAVGTRMSDAVYRRVLEAGQTYADRAFVVNDHYISAYEPIKDPSGRTIGALYVGLLEAPFANRHNLLVTGFLVMVGAASAACLVLMFVVTKRVLRPIGGLIEMSRKVVAGDLTARVEHCPPGEMGELCRAVNNMADAVALREKKLEETTSRQINQSEKLASIGRLAAGVAHEINNPLTGVLTFAHLLREKSNMDAQDRQDLDVIIHETTRVGEIVGSLLDFARERPANKAMVDLNQVVRQTVRLIASQSQFKKIRIEEHLDENLPPVYGDRNQLQQVVLNLALNAGEAMPDGGDLTISTLSRERDVMLSIADTGCGIPKEHLDRIFDPFFTTKPAGKGTGLGLSVSHRIVQQHGGVLSVESEEGRGATFTVALPFGEEPAAPDNEEALIANANEP
ncbi:MAG TPA: cache domain-containing protein [Phycisphaerae bacterium]|nr:cache domain-containing protein [Phycisphaerae bacterium]HOM50068.1 cache domain-containing protein [Phycisphaerae bacterium]HOQ86115.1 cache domain-containing protein [Phycisphaerae bacterium]